MDTNKEVGLDGWEKVESSGSFWEPEIGETLEGVIVDIREGLFGKQWVLQDLNDVQHITPSHKVLQARMANTIKGDLVRIIFKGQDLPKIKGQQGTKLYEVFKKKSKGGKI